MDRALSFFGLGARSVCFQSSETIPTPCPALPCHALPCSAWRQQGLRHPAKLSLGSPRAGVNRLVASERGMTAPRGLSWWDWVDLRVRIWTMDSVLRLVWWWKRRRSFTDRDIG